MRFLTWLLTSAAALAAATLLFDGIWFSGPTQGQAEIEEKLLPWLAVSLILAIVSSVVKPVLTFLSIPFIILTLGLFLLVINALMLLLTSWVATRVGVGWYVDGFGTALLGSVIVAVVSFVLNAFLPDRHQPPRRLRGTRA